MAAQEIECDVLVVGAGAGGLATAVAAAHYGARVVVLERAAVCGGASAWSGGWAWAPGSFFSGQEGDESARDDVRAYLRAVIGEPYDDESIEAFLAGAPEMVRFFHERTRLQFVPGMKINDIYGDLPGAGTGNRSVAPRPVNARRLGRHVWRRVRHQLYETSFLGMGIMAGDDLGAFLSASRGNLGGLVHVGWRMALHVVDMVFHGRSMQLVNGTALIGRLLASASDLGVDVRTSHQVVRLVEERGRVTGAIAQSPIGSLRVRASRGVVISTGGFPSDRALRQSLFPGTPTGQEHWTLAPAESDGTGLALAAELGASVRTELASPAAWCPVSLVPYRSGRVGVFPHIMDRAKPGSIGVLASGRRFVNEANGYYDYVAAMIAAVPDGQPIQAWQIADARYMRRYPLGMAKPRPVPLFPYLRSGYLVRGRTIEELAEQCGIDPDGLRRTIETFNVDAARGTDSEFGRGSTPFNRYGGDARVGPNPSLGPIDRPPYYAVRVLPGSFGTFAGLSADARARVLRADGSPIEGLYVVGNDRASIMGGHYPSGGINLGPALTFGFLVGRELGPTPAPPIPKTRASAERPSMLPTTRERSASRVRRPERHPEEGVSG